VTAVGSFEAVGSVLVVALMIAPPAAAYLLTDRLPVMLGLGVGIGVASAVAGYALARQLDASIAGSMATMTGVFFLLSLLFAPQRGLVARWLRQRRQRVQFAGEMLLVHLSQHEDTPDEAEETAIDRLEHHLRWPPAFGERVVGYVLRHGLAQRVEGNGHLALTEKGRTVAQAAMMR
jgi:manganese/zinc/iron transport system permease protein